MIRISMNAFWFLGYTAVVAGVAYGRGRTNRPKDKTR